jgi:hypothetical protein
VTEQTKRTEWSYWLPDAGHGETEEDAREWRSDNTRAHYVAEEIAERKWHEDSPDYFTSLEVALRAPWGELSVWDVEVRSSPVFEARRKQMAATETKTGA